MDSSSFRGKIQNLSRSFHAYQIDAHYLHMDVNKNISIGSGPRTEIMYKFMNVHK